MSTNNIKAAQDVVRAMKASGQSDAVIADRIQKSANIDDNFKQVFAQAKGSGMASKAVNDFLAIPDQNPVDSKSSVEKSLTASEGDVLNFLGNVSGTKKLGEWSAAQLAKLDPAHRANLAEIAKTNPEEAQQISQGGVNNRELAGSVAQTALGLATPFAGKFLASGNLVQRSLKGAAVGYGFDVAGHLQDNNNATPFAPGLGTVVGGAIPVIGAAGKYVASRFPKLLSIFTGESDEMINAALRDPKAADLAIQNGDAELRKVVEAGAAKSIGLRDQAIMEQANAMKSIAGSSGAKVSRLKLVDSFKQVLEANDVTINKGMLDFSQSKIVANPGEVGKIQTAWNALKGKSGNSLSFEDTLKFKQLVGKLTRFADEAGIPSKSPTLGKVYNNIDNLIKQSLPEASRTAYTEANSKFSNTINLFDDLVDAFNKGDPFSKLAQVGGKNKDTLRQLMEFYREKTGTDVLATAAGRELSMEKSSSGLMGQGFGFRNFFDFLISPKTQARIVVKAGEAGQKMGGSFSAPISKTLAGLQNVSPEELNRFGRFLQQIQPDTVGQAARKVGRTLTGEAISNIQK